MVVNCVAYTSTGRRLREVTVDEISEVLRSKDTFVWVGLYEPDEAMLRSVQREFDLHELAIEDAQHAHQRAKIEVYDEVLFVVAHTAQFVGGKVEFGETHIFMGKRFLLTVRHGASLSYAPVRTRLEQAPQQLSLGPSMCMYGVIDYIVDNVMPVVESFQSELRDLEHQVFASHYSRSTIHRLYSLKRDLVSLRLAVAPLQDILNQLVKLHPGLINDDTRVYFRDVYDHAIRITESINILGEMLTAALQVNMSLVTLGQNESVRKLASWAGLLAVPTLIASLYGMNFEHMPELKWRFGYPAMLVVCVLLCVLIYWQLKRNKWL